MATALQNHYALLEQMRHADESAKWYKTALEDETKRLKEGYSTLFIVIDYENNLSSSMAERVLVYRAFSQNIADLLYLTGRLVTPYDRCDRVMIANVRSMEIFEGAQP